jgi:ABC-type multidrug transport system fused ATPase/permease subunit
MIAVARRRIIHERIFQLLDSQADTAIGRGGATPDAHADGFHGDVVFRDVDFAYPSRPGSPILRGVSLTLPEGKVTAIVGESGSGKSTLAYLLERFFEPDGGHIEMAGHRLSELDPHWLRTKIALVSQEPVLFAGRLRKL